MIIHAIKYLEKQKRLVHEGKENWTTEEKLEQAIQQLKNELNKKGVE